MVSFLGYQLSLLRGLGVCLCFLQAFITWASLRGSIFYKYQLTRFKCPSTAQICVVEIEHIPTVMLWAHYASVHQYQLYPTPSLLNHSITQFPSQPACKMFLLQLKTENTPPPHLKKNQSHLLQSERVRNTVEAVSAKTAKVWETADCREEQ